MIVRHKVFLLAHTQLLLVCRLPVAMDQVESALRRGLRQRGAGAQTVWVRGALSYDAGGQGNNRGEKRDLEFHNWDSRYCWGVELFSGGYYSLSIMISTSRLSWKYAISIAFGWLYSGFNLFIMTHKLLLQYDT